jgi:vacuolar-type H+-ATPase subunit F/Vma7
VNQPQPGGQPLRPDLPPPARLIALGSAALMEGFALIGFETYPDPTPAVLEDLLRGLLHGQQGALVVIEQGLAQNPGRQLTRALREGARIVITEIPALHQGVGYRSRVDRLVQTLLGADALEPSP